MPTVEVALGERSYRIEIGAGLLAQCGTRLAAALGRTTRAALVADANVFAHYGQPVERALREAGFEVVVSTVPTGESAKSLAQTAASTAGRWRWPWAAAWSGT